MLFPTIEFALFFLVVFAVSWGTRRWWTLHKAFLVGASLFFYGAGDWTYLPLLVGTALANYGFGRALGSLSGARHRRLVVGLGVTTNLGVLAIFKYYNFFLENLFSLGDIIGWHPPLPLLVIALPIGISFYIFHGISYLVDVGRGQVEPARSPLDLLLYMSFFPHLLAGPIIRASYFLPQLESPLERDRIRVSSALLLIAVGCTKKIVVAGTLGPTLVDPVFADPGAFGSFDLLLAAYGYAVQIYCDFSGYSDMAVGLAALLGYRFPRNFDHPYGAASLREFWRRWHMSLSTWLRDYLYIPLGGGRHGRWATLRNLLLTMTIGGLWHGANWTFILWGLMHGAALAVERSLDGVALPGGRALRQVIVFHVVCVGWVLFRSPTLDAATAYFGALLGLGGSADVVRHAATPFMVVLIVGALATQLAGFGLVPWLDRTLERCSPLVVATGFAMALFVINSLGPEAGAPFIYFRF